MTPKQRELQGKFAEWQHSRDLGLNLDQYSDGGYESAATRRQWNAFEGGFELAEGQKVVLEPVVLAVLPICLEIKASHANHLYEKLAVEQAFDIAELVAKEAARRKS